MPNLSFARIMFGSTQESSAGGWSKGTLATGLQGGLGANTPLLPSPSWMKRTWMQMVFARAAR